MKTVNDGFSVREIPKMFPFKVFESEKFVQSGMELCCVLMLAL